MQSVHYCSRLRQHLDYRVDVQAAQVILWSPDDTQRGQDIEEPACLAKSVELRTRVGPEDLPFLEERIARLKPHAHVVPFLQPLVPGCLFAGDKVRRPAR